MSFLQQHYNACMRNGASHIEYVLVNDLDKITADRLKENYWKDYVTRKTQKDAGRRQYMKPEPTCKCGHVRIPLSKGKHLITELYVRHPELLSLSTPGSITVQGLISS